MTADSFLEYFTDCLFLLIFLLVLVRTVRYPHKANIDASLLFGAVALIVAEAWIGAALGEKLDAPALVIEQALLMALPYLLLRLVDDFAGLSRRLMWGASGGLVVSVVILVLFHGGRIPLPLTLLLVAYFVGLSAFVAVRVIRAARRSSGVAQRRVQAVAVGTACLALVILLAGVQAAFPHSPNWIWRVAGDTLALACGVSFFVGFTPPAWLRRAWQEPDLRRFLGRSASLPRLPDTASIVRELEYGAARSLGTRTAVIGLWNPSTGALDFDVNGRDGQSRPVDATARRAFAERSAVFAADASRENPGDVAVYRRHGVNSVLAVPIIAGEQPLGVLAVYAARAPIFAEDDLKLAQLLADQAAVILESRALIDEAARVRAREEAARLKDDFLSAAAHDLRTPLTALMAQAQLMQRRARKNPDAPADTAGIDRILFDAQRLRRLVTELLDVSRVEQGKLLSKREEVDLVALARDACDGLSSPSHTYTLDSDGSVTGSFDRIRMLQLLENLLENATKYSPNGGEIAVRVWREGNTAQITVTDEGIGIPEDDLPQLFDRFHRGGNVDDRLVSGLGLGLFICRGIVEQHGGRLWATSPGPGQGSTFHVELPISPSLVADGATTSPGDGAAVPAGQSATAPHSATASGDAFQPPQPLTSWE